MFSRCFFLVLAFLPLTHNLEAKVCGGYSAAPTFSRNYCEMPSSIRILITHNVPGVELGVTGQYTLYDPVSLNRGDCGQKDHFIGTRYKGKCRYLETLIDGLKWGEEFPGQHQLKIVDDLPTSRTIVQGIEYKGPLYIYNVAGTISIVNELPIEEYVRNYLNQNYNTELEIEALYALAIIERTNAYFLAQNPKSPYWAIEAEKINYRGLACIHEKVNQAIYYTNRMVLSRTGVYEGVITPFMATFETSIINPNHPEVVKSQISIDEANQMAKNGLHAAQIIAKAFPGSTIMMTR